MSRCYILILLAPFNLLYSCEEPRPHASPAQHGELRRAFAFLSERATIEENWRLTSTTSDTSEFVSAFRSATGDGRRFAVTASITPGNVARERFDISADALNRHRVRAGPYDERTGLMALDQGWNVFKVHFIGAAADGMNCDIQGFGSPSLIAKCGWEHDGYSFFVETHPSVISDVLTNKGLLEQAWASARRHPPA